MTQVTYQMIHPTRILMHTQIQTSVPRVGDHVGASDGSIFGIVRYVSWRIDCDEAIVQYEPKNPDKQVDK